MACQHIKHGFCHLCIMERLVKLAEEMIKTDYRYSVNVLNKLVK